MTIFTEQQVQTFITSFSQLYHQDITVDQTESGVQITGPSTSIKKIHVIISQLPDVNYVGASKKVQLLKKDYSTEATCFKVSDVYQKIILTAQVATQVHLYIEQQLKLQTLKNEKVCIENETVVNVALENVPL